MARLRPELEDVVEVLLAASERSREVSLDAIGDAIGARAVSPDDVDAIMRALEAKDRRVVGPEGGGGEARLARVIDAARALKGELGRAATASEIAVRSGLSLDEVRHALALARVMQR